MSQCSDGTPDSTFGDNGVVLDDYGAHDNHATSVAVQPDGGIIVAGYSDSAGLDLVRYLPDGTEDPNFQNWNAAGVAAGAVYGIAIEPNNTILVGGSFDSENAFGVMSFNVDGSLAGDMTLGPYSGSPDDNSAVCAMAIAPDGSVIEAGTQGHFWDPGYSSNVPLLARLYVGDIGGAQVRVDDAYPALPLSGDGYVAAGDTYTVTLGTSSTGEGINLGSGSDVSYTINWGDGSPATTITADDLAAADDEVSHVFNATTSGISVDLDVTGDPDSPYTDVGGLSVNVDTNTATTTALTVSNSTPAWGGTESLTATVSTDLYGIATPTGTVEFYDGTIELGPGTLNTYGVATLTTPPLFSGEHDFTAVYGSDSVFTGSTSTAAAATVASAPSPSLTMTGASSIDEGATYTLALPTTAGGHTITSWVINWGDGSANSVLSGDPTSTTHAFGAGGTFSVTAIAINSVGNAYAASMGNTVAVSHADPSGLTLTADDATYSGADVTAAGGLADDELHGSFTGPESLSSYTITINWGDGSDSDPDLTTFTLPPGTSTFDYPLPQYANTGAYTITVTVTDPETNSTSSTIDVNYTNSAPSALALSLDETTVYAGDTPVLSGSFTDPQFNDSQVVTIDWGDGGGTPDTTTISLDAGETTFQADPHTYSTPGSYTISVVVAGIDGTVTNSMSVTVNAIPDQVMIGSLVPVAWESGGQMGQFEMSRAGGTTGDLWVNYTVSGSAANGTDYDTLAGPVEILAGESSVIVYVDTIDLGLTSGSSTVVLTLDTGTGYTVVSSFTSATVTIADNDPSGGSYSGDTVASIECFDPDGLAADSPATAVVGDFIAIGVAGIVGTGGANTYLNVSSNLIVSTSPDPSDSVSNPITLTSAYTIYYVFASSSSVDADVSGDVSVSLTNSGGTFTLCSAPVEYEPLQLFRTGVSNGSTAASVDITNGNAATATGNVAAALNVKVGETITLQINDPLAVPGMVVNWSMPPGNSVKDYQPTIDYNGFTPAASSCAPKYLSFADLSQIGAAPPALSYAWVDGGTGRTESAAVWPSPFGWLSVGATFNVTRPTARMQPVPIANSSVVEVPVQNGTTYELKDAQGKPVLTFDAKNPSAGFQYNWCQVLTKFDLTSSLGADEHYVNALDDSFPYSHPKTTPLHSEDIPGISNIGDPTDANDKAFFEVTATMWYTCKPEGVSGIWVPLYEYTWHLKFELKATKKGNGYVWEIVNPAYPIAQNFQSTIQFPSWSDTKVAPIGS